MRAPPTFSGSSRFMPLCPSTAQSIPGTALTSLRLASALPTWTSATTIRAPRARSAATSSRAAATGSRASMPAASNAAASSGAGGAVTPKMPTFVPAASTSRRRRTAACRRARTGSPPDDGRCCLLREPPQQRQAERQIALARQQRRRPDAPVRRPRAGARAARSRPRRAACRRRRSRAGARTDRPRRAPAPRRPRRARDRSRVARRARPPSGCTGQPQVLVVAVAVRRVEQRDLLAARRRGVAAPAPWRRLDGSPCGGGARRCGRRQAHAGTPATTRDGRAREQRQVRAPIATRCAGVRCYTSTPRDHIGKRPSCDQARPTSDGRQADRTSGRGRRDSPTPQDGEGARASAEPAAAEAALEADAAGAGAGPRAARDGPRSGRALPGRGAPLPAPVRSRRSARWAWRSRERGDMNAARTLVVHNLRLVIAIAYQYRRAWTNILDLFQEGSVGLMEAVKRWEPTLGPRFGTYAAYWIRAYVLRFLMTNSRLIHVGNTRAGRKLFFRLEKERQKLLAAGFDVDAQAAGGEAGRRREGSGRGPPAPRVARGLVRPAARASRRRRGVPAVGAHRRGGDSPETEAARAEMATTVHELRGRLPRQPDRRRASARSGTSTWPPTSRSRWASSARASASRSSAWARSPTS